MKRDIAILVWIGDISFLLWKRIFATGGRFPIEQSRVRFAVFPLLLQKLMEQHPAHLGSHKTLLITLCFYSQTPFFVTAFATILYDPPILLFGKEKGIQFLRVVSEDGLYSGLFQGLCVCLVIDCKCSDRHAAVYHFSDGRTKCCGE